MSYPKMSDAEKAYWAERDKPMPAPQYKALLAELGVEVKGAPAKAKPAPVEARARAEERKAKAKAKDEPPAPFLDDGTAGIVKTDG